MACKDSLRQGEDSLAEGGTMDLTRQRGAEAETRWCFHRVEPGDCLKRSLSLPLSLPLSLGVHFHLKIGLWTWWSHFRPRPKVDDWLVHSLDEAGLVVWYYLDAGGLTVWCYLDAGGLMVYSLDDDDGGGARWESLDAGGLVV